MATRTAARRSYNQYCGIARALDLIGERWTLLIVRELLLGPLRYTDLLESLSGIGTNLLARRLQDLEEARVIERTILPRPATGTAYKLTARGRALEPALVLLGRFGGAYLPPRIDDEEFRPRWGVIGLKHTFRPALATGLVRRYEVVLDGEHFLVAVADGQLTTSQGAPEAPDVVLRSAARDLLQVLSGAFTPEEAIASGLTVVEISPRTLPEVRDPAAELATFVRIFGWAEARERP